jgi:hypothetical protein
MFNRIIEFNIEIVKYLKAVFPKVCAVSHARG